VLESLGEGKGPRRFGSGNGGGMIGMA